jgi:hypothetical protein
VEQSQAKAIEAVTDSADVEKETQEEKIDHVEEVAEQKTAIEDVQEPSGTQEINTKPSDEERNEEMTGPEITINDEIPMGEITMNEENVDLLLNESISEIDDSLPRSPGHSAPIASAKIIFKGDILDNKLESDDDNKSEHSFVDDEEEGDKDNVLEKELEGSDSQIGDAGTHSSNTQEEEGEVTTSAILPEDDDEEPVVTADREWEDSGRSSETDSEMGGREPSTIEAQSSLSTGKIRKKKKKGNNDDSVVVESPPEVATPVEKKAVSKTRKKVVKPGVEKTTNRKKKVVKKKVVEKPKIVEEPYKGKLSNEGDSVYALELHALLNVSPQEYSNGGFPDTRVIELITLVPELCSLQFYSDYLECRSYPLALLCALGASFDTIKKCYEINSDALLASNFAMGMPLHFACMYGASIEVLSFLADTEPATLLEMNKLRRVPLHTACASDARLEVISFLVDKKMMACSRTDKGGMTALHLACGCTENVEVIDCLVKAYPLACVARDEAGLTPLHVAVRRHAPIHILKSLLKAHDAALKVKDEQGMIPLHHAVSSPEADVNVVLLLLYGYPDSTLCRTKSGETPLQLAQKVNTHPQILQLLYPNV